MSKQKVSLGGVLGMVVVICLIAIVIEIIKWIF